MTGPRARMVLQYFDDCPNWRIADEHLNLALAEVGSSGAVIEYEIVDTDERAQSSGFHGSPTILLDGVDPFADQNAAVGLTCRRYANETGFAGAPSVAQLVAALRDAHAPLDSRTDSSASRSLSIENHAQAQWMGLILPCPLRRLGL